MKSKKQRIAEIEGFLRSNPGVEVCVKDFGWQMRNAFCMKAYAIVSNNGTDVYCLPWAGANVFWRIPWFRLTAFDVRTIYDKIINI